VIFNTLGGPLQTGFLLHLGATPVQVGIAAAIPSLMNVVQILGALVLQKLGNRKLLLVVLSSIHRLFWVGTGLVPFLFPPGLWVPVYLCFYAFGFANNAIGGVAWTSLVGDMVPAAIRGSYFGFRNMVISGVIVICLFFGGWVLDTYPGATGFHILYAVCAVMMIWNTACFTLYPNLPFERSEEKNHLGLLRRPFQDKKYLGAMIFISLWLFVQNIALPMFSYGMLKVLELNVQWVTTAVIVQNLATMASNLVWGRLNNKYSTRLLLFWTLPVIAASCLVWGLIGILPTLLIIFISHLLVGTGVGGFNLLIFNYTIGDTPKSERPMFVAVFSALTGIAGFTGSILGGYLFDWTAAAPQWVQDKGIFTGLGALLLIVALTAGQAALRDRQPRKVN
jgi:MFS family permease